MNKKTLITSGLLLIVLFGLMMWGRFSQSSVAPESSTNSATENSLLSSETVYDFGEISMADGLVSHTFKITNPTTEDIKVKTVNTSCMCTTAYIESANGEKGPFSMQGMGYNIPANEVIKAGDSMDIKVVYDPNAHGPAGVGMIDRFVYVTDIKNRTLELEIKAVVTP